jgi:CheY-like chemotaxis protein
VLQQTVLVVEDDPVQREGLRCLLEQEGYAVALAAGPGEALARLRGPPTPDLILLDMLHPSSREGDGWHFLYQRRQLPDLRAIPVVIVTALGNASSEWAESLGAVGLLRKPVDGEQVVAEVRRLLGARRQPEAGPREAVRPTVAADVTHRTDPRRADDAAAGLARALLGRLLHGRP